MKLDYVKPTIEIETFVTNEYVTACWGVACSVDAANEYEIDHNNYYNGSISHSSDHCGTASNQYLVDYDNDGDIDYMIETGTDGLGNLICTTYTNSSYTNSLNISTVTSGDYIYWTTTSDNRTWHHQGTVSGSSNYS